MRRPRRQGFTLVECIVSLLIIAFLLAGFYSLLAAAFATSQLPSVTLNGTAYAKAPDIGQMNAAVSAQTLIQQLQQSADAILVFGGKGSHPNLDPTGPSSVIAWASWPTSLGNGPVADPARQFSSWDQRSVAADVLSPLFINAGSPADFSVVFVQGLNRITGIAKQRRQTATLNLGLVNCYDVAVESFTYGSAGAVSATQTEGYHIYYPTGEDNWRILPGAEHVWFRYDNNTSSPWDRDEEAGAFLVFADPYVVAGENPDSEVLPVSEFSFYVPVAN
jgi:prepilin-type N-terminal cleavage/methylation domain-containing protein